MGISNAFLSTFSDWLQQHRSLFPDRISALTFGRQDATQIDAEYFSKKFNLDQSIVKGSPYCELLFSHLGIDVQSIDYSTYEGASLTANLALDNTEHFMSSGVLNAFDIVMDIGTSEHVINPIVSHFNAYQLVKNGGVIVLNLPVTGWFNHGLFNFNPSYFMSIQNEFMTLTHLEFIETLPSTQPDNFFRWPRSGGKILPADYNLMSFAVYQKRAGMSLQSLIEGTIQDCYKNTLSSTTS